MGLAGTDERREINSASVCYILFWQPVKKEPGVFLIKLLYYIFTGIFTISELLIKCKDILG
jgi:hypothetical protein